jgi:hypothetical protein
MTRARRQFTRRRDTCIPHLALRCSVTFCDCDIELDGLCVPHRRMAERQGLMLHKSRRRDPRALDFGRYWLTPRNDPTTTELTGSLDIIEDGLTGKWLDLGDDTP